jgi:hypothetical protein
MTEENVPAEARDDDDTRSLPRVSPPATGSESNRELQDVSRRRRESEEKLQQHLKEAQDKETEDKPARQDGPSE